MGRITLKQGMPKAPKRVGLHVPKLPFKRQIQVQLRGRRGLRGLCGRRCRRVRHTALKKRVGFHYERLAAMQNTIGYVSFTMPPQPKDARGRRSPSHNRKKKPKPQPKTQEADSQEVLQTMLTVVSMQSKPQPEKLSGNAFKDNVFINVDIEEATFGSQGFPEGEFDTLIASSFEARLFVDLSTEFEVYRPSDAGKWFNEEEDWGYSEPLVFPAENDVLSLRTLQLMQEFYFESHVFPAENNVSSPETLQLMQDKQRKVEDAQQEASGNTPPNTCCQLHNQEKLDALERGY